MQCGHSLEGVVWHSNICSSSSRLDDLVDGHHFSLDAIQEAGAELVAPPRSGIGAVGSVVVAGVGAWSQVQNVYLRRIWVCKQTCHARFLPELGRGVRSRMSTCNAYRYVQAHVSCKILARVEAKRQVHNMSLQCTHVYKHICRATCFSGLGQTVMWQLSTYYAHQSISMHAVQCVARVLPSIQVQDACVHVCVDIVDMTDAGLKPRFSTKQQPWDIPNIRVIFDTPSLLVHFGFEQQFRCDSCDNDTITLNGVLLGPKARAKCTSAAWL